MSGKNIFIGFIIVIILLIIILFTFQIQQYNFYKQFETTKQVQDWVIKNIKNQKGEIGNRYFGVQSRYRNKGFPILVQIFSQKYFCFDPNVFKNLEESYKFENPSPPVEKPLIKN